MKQTQAEQLRERPDLIAQLTDQQAFELRYDWAFWARAEQLPQADDWRFWVILAGRGFGKTRTGAEWCRQQVKVSKFVNLIGPTADSARDVMIEGESGILAICPASERPLYKKGARKLIWPNGAESLIFSAEEPDRLRGPQSEKIWADELAAWKYAESWDQALLGLRLGRPQALVTTTPRPTKAIRDLLTQPGTIVTRGSTYDNESNLAPSFFKQIIKKYEGTRLGRQELNAEILDDNPNALWQRARIDELRVDKHPELKRVVVAIDPAVTSGEESNYTGIIVVGVGDDDHGYVLADLSLKATPAEWGKVAVEAYRKYQADRIVGEINNGGDLIEHVLRTVDPNVSYKKVHASRGKQKRAEPVAALYEQGRFHHVGQFGPLEDEMVTFDQSMDGESPDRMDALVWAGTDLFLDERVEGGGVFKDRWKTWTEKAAPPCDQIVQAAHLEVTETNVTYGIATFGVFRPSKEPAVRPKPGEKIEPALDKPSVILLDFSGGTGTASEFTELLRLAYASHKPNFLLIGQSNDVTPLITHVRRERISAYKIKYDPQTSPQIAAETLSAGRAWMPKKDWARRVRLELQRYPFGERTATAHAVSLVLLWLRHMKDVHPVFEEDKEPEHAPETVRAIYG